MTPPHAKTIAAEAIEATEGIAVTVDPARSPLIELMESLAAMLPPGALEALASAASGLAVETERRRAAEAAAMVEKDRERDAEIKTSRAAAEVALAKAAAAEAALDEERIARRAADDVARGLQARVERLRNALTELGAQAARIVAADTEWQAPAAMPADAARPMDTVDAASLRTPEIGAVVARQADAPVAPGTMRQARGDHGGRLCETATIIALTGEAETETETAQGATSRMATRGR